MEGSVRKVKEGRWKEEERRRKRERQAEVAEGCLEIRAGFSVYGK